MTEAAKSNSHKMSVDRGELHRIVSHPLGSRWYVSVRKFMELSNISPSFKNEYIILAGTKGHVEEWERLQSEL